MTSTPFARLLLVASTTFVFAACGGSSASTTGATGSTETTAGATAGTTSASSTTGAVTATSITSSASTGHATTSGATTSSTVASSSGTTGHETTNGTTGTTVSSTTAGATTGAASTAAATTGAASTGAATTAGATTGGTTGMGTTSGAASGTTSGSTTGGCTGPADCNGVQFCDILYGQTAGSCCPTIPSTSTLYVDDGTGHDVACCGTTLGTACQTITHAMSELAATDARLSTIVASHSGTGHNWTAPEPNLPILLRVGVTLTAPGIYFSGTAPSGVFMGLPLNDIDTDPVTIEGDDTGNIFIGLSQDDSTNPPTLSNAGVDYGLVVYTTVNLSYATVSASVGAAGTDYAAIYVEDGVYAPIAHLILGPGPVVVGGDTTPGTRGSYGIYCSPNGGEVTDVAEAAGAAGPLTAIFNQNSADIDAEEGCSITLENGLALGSWTFDATNQVFTCNTASNGSYLEGFTGLIANGTAQVTLEGAKIACTLQDGIGIYALDSSGDGPSVTLYQVDVAHAGCAALYNAAGSVLVDDGQFASSVYGVIQRFNGSTDLSGDGDIGSEATCNNAYEPGNCSLVSPGVNGTSDKGFNVWNDGQYEINAENCYWDTYPPPVYTCTDQVGVACTPSAPGNGSDVMISPDPISGGTASTVDTSFGYAIGMGISGCQ